MYKNVKAQHVPKLSAVFCEVVIHLGYIFEWKYKLNFVCGARSEGILFQHSQSFTYAF